MSEEEIIEIVENIKNHQIAIFEPKENIQVTRNYFTKEQREAIEGLINLYKQEKEKNKELEKHYEHEQEYINAEVFSAKQMHIIDEDYISKDKIKEKIEELEKEQKEYKNSQEWEIQDDIVSQINILKDLLEEN